ncbi:MAG: zf-TFIIB domain-containing protein [Candidatus Yanofskybacteria bacterium]|nr:zf-TFIIB domain-containing protein [Candidatus Yanofskybacteria bacterium]
MNKKCPHHLVSLEQALLSGVEVDYCPTCYGLWFDQEELRWAKDEKDKDLRWLDIDLWRNQEKLRISPGNKLCPVHRLPLYEVQYGDSNIKVDVCNVSHGVWLDRGEFKEILAYLKEKGRDEIYFHHLRNLRNQLWEVFVGPELLKEELLDVLAVLKLMQYKFAAQHPRIVELASRLPA